MAELRLRYSIIWLVFLGVTFTGAALLFSPEESDDLLGVGLVLAPLLLFGALLSAYYWKSRRVT